MLADASRNHRLKAIKFLMERGGNPDYVSSGETTSTIDQARQKQQWDVVEALLKRP
jgi:hypothetical protein